MKYKLIQKPNPLEPHVQQRKWYASPVKEGTVNNDQLSRDIAARSPFPRSVVMNVIEKIADEIPRYLTEGFSVNLSDLGTLRLSLSSEGVDTPEKFSTENIENVRIIFTPSPEFKRTLLSVQYERAE